MLGWVYKYFQTNQMATEKKKLPQQPVFCLIIIIICKYCFYLLQSYKCCAIILYVLYIIYYRASQESTLIDLPRSWWWAWPWEDLNSSIVNLPLCLGYLDGELNSFVASNWFTWSIFQRLPQSILPLLLTCFSVSPKASLLFWQHHISPLG